MALSVHLRIRPEQEGREPGNDPDNTTLWDEGCGMLCQSELMESVSRHLVNLIHIWSEDGFKPVHDQWMARLSKKGGLAAGLSLSAVETALLGLDESGNALIKTGSGVVSLLTTDALDQLRAQRGGL